MPALDHAPHLPYESREQWRAWLEANHAGATGVWLVSWRSGRGKPPLDYDAAVEEALCFGWVDGQTATLDEARAALYFAPRRPRSAWAQSNKARVERLIAAGRMAPAGLAAIERAKADGTWSMLDGAARLEVPPELDEALDAHPPARANWDGFSASVRRMSLEYLAMARRAETRRKRAAQVAEAAAQNLRFVLGERVVPAPAPARWDRDGEASEPA